MASIATSNHSPRGQQVRVLEPELRGNFGGAQGQTVAFGSGVSLRRGCTSFKSQLLDGDPNQVERGFGVLERCPSENVVAPVADLDASSFELLAGFLDASEVADRDLLPGRECGQFSLRHHIFYNENAHDYLLPGNRRECGGPLWAGFKDCFDSSY
jgi:hypothetical protein